MNPKIISLLITLSFICVFSVGAVYFIKPEISYISKGGFQIGESMNKNKSTKPSVDLSPTYIKVEYNEYIKAISGAAIGWAVKEICSFLLNFVKIFLKKQPS